ncbi:Tim44 domain-containing protein [Methylococcus capsulatus]|uniref:Tim44 domain-containing protein n=1 Tax=Methylococcus capsulatus TaxID=414 RepID=UPI001C52B8B3|nr:Tim44-like domain-containing protein [Methylococcus capsulatus]QXP88023.1 39S ribosomal protein L45 [Methylococcus capsulatus]QXP94965.1 39S ribosomal protein L45 [Methylococcus capsulatus]UQN13050.1 Tim44-like domain-containing protein [Methylococcus capsulatus]
MKKILGFALNSVLVAALLFSGMHEAFAKRLGGGSSFGSRPSYSEPYRRSTDGNTFSQTQRPAYQPSQPATAASQRNQAAREAYARRGGLMGMLGGLALGGLLGAMLFGGAFEHLNVLDLLLFAGIGFFLYRLLAARGSQPQPAAGAGYYPHSENPGGANPVSGRPAFDTDLLSRRGGAQPAQSQPADFDATGFLNGAKAAYRQLQAAWDERDLGTLRALTTDKVFAELQDQLRASAERHSTELLRVDAEILEVRDRGDEREVAVLFDVTLREAPAEEAAVVHEVWHFVRSRSSRQPTWFLDGIQQVEA